MTGDTVDRVVLAETTTQINNLLQFVSKLESTPEDFPNDAWANDGLWQTLGGNSYGINIWNILDENDREDLAEYFDNATSHDKKERRATQLAKSVRQSFEINYLILNKCWNEILSSHASHIRQCMRWFRNVKKLCLVPTDNRMSIDASSVTSASSVGTVKKGMTLVADRIHYNMFNSPELELQRFRRFKFPASLEGVLRVLDEREQVEQNEMVELYQTLLEFMLEKNKEALEPATQQVFLLFMEEFLKSFFPGFSAVPVTGMKAIKQDMHISETHLKLQDPGYSDGALPVTLSLESDAVICPIVNLKPKPNENDQQNLFINCNVNIEMKRLRLLYRKRNNSRLTQVCTESMVRNRARMSGQNSSKGFLFSILSDFMGIYVLCHDQKENEYWICRQENDPERIVPILIWLMQLATSSLEDQKALRQFLRSNVCPDADKTARYDRNDPRPKDTASSAGSSYAPQGRQPKSENPHNPKSELRMTASIAFEDLLSEEDTWPEQPDYFYAFQAQRIFGANVTLTDDLIVRHDIGSEMVPWPKTTQYARTFGDMKVDMTALQTGCSPTGPLFDTPLSDLNMLDMYQSLGDNECNASSVDMEIS